MIRGLVALLCVAMVLAAGAEARGERMSACPAPKPLPAGVKKPPAGASATQLANFLLALPQRKPCDIGLFTSEFQPGPWPGLYPEGPPMQPLPAVVPSEATVRSQLIAFLGASAGKAAALALFDRADVKRKVPDPTLRAALVALRGTVGEPAIEFFLQSRAYAAPPRFGGTGVGNTARVFGATGSRSIVFNRRYQSEHFALLSATFAHEILHHDAPNTATEEVILHALTGAVDMQILARHPELATRGTELSRFANDQSLLLVNSRDAGASRSAIFAPRGKGTAPGSARSQRDLAGHGKEWGLGGVAMRPSDNTPAPAIFPAVLRRILAPSAKVPKPLTYSTKTAQLFSKMNDTWLSPVDRLRVNVLLGLVSTEEIVKYTGLTRSKAISTFELAPILAAMK